jgi:uncharacterized protein YegL
MSFRRYFVFTPVLFVAIWSLHSGGCAATEGTRAGGESDATAQATSSGASTGGAGGGGGPASSGFGGTGDSSAGDAPLDPDASCASTSAAAELLPLDMLILLDRSGSMLGSKWNDVRDAIIAFVNDAASTGMNVGLTYFPRGLTGQNDCSEATYSPLAVSIGELPANRTLLVDSIQATSPSGGTPMRPALEGVLFNATAYQTANPAHKVIVVLATDGDPSGCSDNTVPATAQLATRALNYNGVQTYVIAVEGATLSNLNQIAAAGGTTQAYDVTSNIAAFSAKMAEIRASALPCELLIPEPPAGASFEVGKVAVSFTPGAGPEVEIPKANNASDCRGTPGWYYDDNVSPDKIILCPASCAAVQDDSQARLNVLFGCEPTLTNPN